MVVRVHWQGNVALVVGAIATLSIHRYLDGAVNKRGTIDSVTLFFSLIAAMDTCTHTRPVNH